MVSILDSIKTMCGISSDDDGFDSEMIMYINSVLGILTQLGIGPSAGFSISDSVDVWADFLEPTHPDFELIKTYTYSKVRLMFDPPQNSFLVDALKQQISELEWRIELNASMLVTEEQTEVID